MFEAELDLSSSGLQVLVGKMLQWERSPYVVGQGSLCSGIESSVDGGRAVALSRSVAGRDPYVTRGSKMAAVREGQPESLPHRIPTCLSGFILSAGRIRILIDGRLASPCTV